MSLISQSIANLFNGVSQQPASLRHASQAELQENAYPSIASGLRKRNPTQHLAKLTSTQVGNAFIHMINRDVTERYNVIVTNGGLAVYDLLGVQKTVTFPDGTAYLNASDPSTSFALVTVADYTFVVNKTVVTAMDATSAAPGVSTRKQKFSDLPVASGGGAIFEVEGDPSNNFDNYFVKDAASAVYTECPKPGVLTAFNPATMPHQLVRNGDGTFTFKRATWTARLIGDDVSNPQPSFISRKIKDVFFYRNRLGFISDEYTVMSCAGDFFNFWAQTATAVLDGDPVDVGTSNTKVSILNYAIPFNKSLMLFSDQTQFQLTAGDILTPKTAKIDAVTEFESSRTCRPVGIGQELFFPVEKENYTSVREYYVDTDTVSNDAADVTAHVPTYMPAGVFKMSASSTEDCVFALTSNDPSSIYVYKFYWAKEDKVQSAWSKFVLNGADAIKAMDFIGSVLYLVIQRADGLYLESMSLMPNQVDTGLPYQVLLDRRVTLTGVYNAGTNTTTWTLPYAESADMAVVLGPSFTGRPGALVGTSRPSSTTIAAFGNYSTGSCYVGRKYTMRYRFSEQFVRDQDKVSITGGKLKLKRLRLVYNLSGYFRVEVTPRAREKYTYPFTARVLGALSSMIGTAAIDTGVFSFPVLTDSQGVVIDIVNDSHLPSTFQSAEWDAEFTTKTNRR